MDNFSTDNLTDRVNRLERKNRRLNRFGAVVFIAMTALFLGGAQRDRKPDVVEAERIILRGKDGKVLASLEANKDGLPNLYFYDKDAKERIGIGLDLFEEVGTGAGIDIRGNGTKGRIGMGVTPHGVSTLIVAEPGGEQVSLTAAGKPDNRAVLALGHDPGGDGLSISSRGGESTMNFLRENKTLLTVSKGKDGAADLVVHDDDAHSRLILGRKSDGSAFLKLQDKEGKTLFQIP